MKCTCGNEMEYEDNSIITNGNDAEGIYYCCKCGKLYDGMELDCYDEYCEITRNKKKYLRWFSDTYKAKKQIILDAIINSRSVQHD